jgi:hypothetical protein
MEASVREVCIDEAARVVSHGETIVAAQRQHEPATERMPVCPGALKNWAFAVVFVHIRHA